MDVAGRVSKQMLKHYSHIRMDAKRAALESIVQMTCTRFFAHLVIRQFVSFAKFPFAVLSGRFAAKREQGQGRA
jgi:hypothetical protein